ncbi:MAG: NAD(P)-dependent malic enzyme [Anaerolineae bacterium]
MVTANQKELAAQAQKPAEEAMRLHPFYGGKIQTAPKCPVRDYHDFSIWYTPGVAAPCKAIQANPELLYEMTNVGNTIAVVSDGTRVLGLGDIGPAAAMPVMEGKALLFKYLGGVDAVPICLDTKDPDKLIEAVKLLEPSFAGINLEDIEQPKCFYILDRLRAEMSIPVWHDDQQGTATIILAGLINAAEVVGKKLSEMHIVVFGSGAANVATVRLLLAYGVHPAQLIVVDSRGILHAEREDIAAQRDVYRDKWRLCQITNTEGRKGGPAEAFRGADAVIALSKPGPGTIKPEWVASMAPKAVVFACANPTPEIWPWEAKDAGAAVVATGRSDFPNQVNNSLVFPGIFRGALDVRARTITDEMCLAAADELARMARRRELDPDFIVPTMDDVDVFVAEAVAVGMKAQEQGVAKKRVSREALWEHAQKVIYQAHELTRIMMEEGLIPAMPA